MSLPTVGKISIEYVNIFLSKYISDGAIDMKLSPDVSNNPSNPHKEIKTYMSIKVMCNKLEWHRE